jgi:hypothetical protein
LFFALEGSDIVPSILEALSVRKYDGKPLRGIYWTDEPVNGVIAPVAIALLDEAEAAHRTLWRAVRVLEYLQMFGHDDLSETFWRVDEWQIAGRAHKERREPMAEVLARASRLLACFR